MVLHCPVLVKFQFLLWDLVVLVGFQKGWRIFLYDILHIRRNMNNGLPLVIYAQQHLVEPSKCNPSLLEEQQDHPSPVFDSEH